MLIVHIIFGLLFYPVSLQTWKIQNKISFSRISFIEGFLLNPFVYWGFRVAVVLLWIYWGMLLGDHIGLSGHREFPNARDELASIYMVAWIIAVVCFSIKAHWDAEKSYGIQSER